MAKSQSTSSQNLSDSRPPLRRAPRVFVKVEQRHIDGAVPESSSSCMIAEAIKELVPTATYVTVDLHTIRWTDRKKQCRYEYLTPRPGQISLLKFDRGVPVDPVEFWLSGARVIRSDCGRMRPEKAARSDGKAVRKRRKIRYGKARIVDGDRKGAAPVVVGGRATPHFGRYGAVRKFGLRGLLPNQVELEDA